MQRPFILLITLLLASCTRFYYQGKTQVLTANGEVRHIVLYWQATKPLFGRLKADNQITLNTECGGSITFNQKKDGIYFFGDPGRDMDENGNPVQDQNYVCGKILNFVRLDEFSGDEIEFEVTCRPIENEFSTAAMERNYPNNDHSAIKVYIARHVVNGFSGKNTAPAPVACTDSSHE